MQFSFPRALLFIGLTLATGTAIASHHYFQLDSASWTAIGTILLVVVTGILAIVGYEQVQDFKYENKKTRTLNACDRYDTDVLLDASLRNIRKGRLSVGDSNLFTNADVYRTDIVSVLNYLDSIAIGIEQGLYIEELSKDHLNEILQRHVDEFLRNPEIPKKAGFDVQDYIRLKSLADRWQTRPIQYKDGQRTSRGEKR